MSKWIIDTNIICHWIMATEVLSPLVKHFKLSQEFIDVYKTRYCDSCNLLDEISNYSTEHAFIIEDLSISELLSAVRNEVRAITLFVKGVPLSKWGSERDSESGAIGEELSRQIMDYAMKGFDRIISDKKVAIIETHTPSSDPDYIDVYSSLVFLCPGLRTQDAIIICSGIFEKAEYLITTDSYLIKLNKIFFSRYNLNIVKPSSALNKLKVTSHK